MRFVTDHDERAWRYALVSPRRSLTVSWVRPGLTGWGRWWSWTSLRGGVYHRLVGTGRLAVSYLEVATWQS